MTTDAIVPARKLIDRSMALNIFVGIVLLHFVEHLIQAFQIWQLNWARPDANGMIGLAFPVLVRTEALHFAYAVIMIAGLIWLRPAIRPEARPWWNVALGIQAFHFLEHFLLWTQWLFGWRLGGRAVPTSLIQLLAPRVELHMVYNIIVIIPMMLALSLHWLPPRKSHQPPAGAA